MHMKQIGYSNRFFAKRSASKGSDEDEESESEYDEEEASADYGDDIETERNKKSKNQIGPIQPKQPFEPDAKTEANKDIKVGFGDESLDGEAEIESDFISEGEEEDEIKKTIPEAIHFVPVPSTQSSVYHKKPINIRQFELDVVDFS